MMREIMNKKQKKKNDELVDIATRNGRFILATTYRAILNPAVKFKIK